MLLPFCILGAVCNRARGSSLYGLTGSTVLSRLVSTFMISLAAGILSNDGIPVFLFAWASLMLWCTPAWDAYWSAAIGNDPVHSRLWGLGAMTTRQLLAIPCIAGLAFITGQSPFWAIGTIILGLPYYISGYLLPASDEKLRKYVIAVPEYTVGTILSFLIYMVIT